MRIRQQKRWKQPERRKLSKKAVQGKKEEQENRKRKPPFVFRLILFVSLIIFVNALLFYVYSYRKTYPVVIAPLSPLHSPAFSPTLPNGNHKDVSPEKHVPSERSVISEKSMKKSDSRYFARVNINLAGEEELCRLPGIGETRARAIIEYRRINGPFRKPEDLMNIRGIGVKMFGRIRGMIIVK